MKTEAPAPDVAWRGWSAEDAAKQPKRTCSVAGCKGAPDRVKVTTIAKDDGSTVERRHVYCALHLPAE